MDKSKCRASVYGRSFGGGPCSRKAGFGKDGLYCKQHAKQYPADNQETVTMYAAKQRYSGFDLVSCEVFDVTDASLVVKSARVIFGYSMPTGPTRFSTDNWQWFSTAREALLWIERAVNGKVLSLRAEAVRMEQSLEPVQRMLALEDIEQRVADAVAERTMSIKRELGYET